MGNSGKFYLKKENKIHLKVDLLREELNIYNPQDVVQWRETNLFINLFNLVVLVNQKSRNCA